MTPAAPPSEGLYGCGRLRNGEGGPLRPGGLALTEELVALAGFAAGDVVADIGCGLGASTQFLRARHRGGRRRHRLGVWPAARDALRRRRRGCVAVRRRKPRRPYCRMRLSTLADPARALAEWRRALKPGGRLALSDVYSRAAASAAGWRRAKSFASA